MVAFPKASCGKARTSHEESDGYSERLVADIVLQNGDKILCVEPLGPQIPHIARHLLYVMSLGLR